MTQRLQVLVSDAEMEQIRVAARSAGVSVGEWVRQAVRRELGTAPHKAAEAKLMAVREAVAVYAAPAVDIEQMIEEIERGYKTDLP